MTMIDELIKSVTKRFHKFVFQLLKKWARCRVPEIGPGFSAGYPDSETRHKLVPAHH